MSTQKRKKPAGPAYNSKQPYIGFGGIRHDSKSEAKISFLLARHGWFSTRGASFPGKYKDLSGAQHVAKPDFRHITGATMETKFSDLNAKETKAAADAAVAAYKEFHQVDELPMKAQLELEWPHSRYKQAAVQEWQGVWNHVLLFSKRPSAVQQTKLAQVGLFWITAADLLSFSAFLVLRQYVPGIGYRQGHFQLGGADPLASTVQLQCRSAEVLDEEEAAHKAAGYRLKRGSKTATTATLVLKH